MRIIFLDIDGVIISAGAAVGSRGIFQSRKLMPYCATQVALLKEICVKTGAKIVINSTHGSSIGQGWRHWVKRRLFDTISWQILQRHNFWTRLYWFIKMKKPVPDIHKALVKAGIPRSMFHKDIRTAYPNGDRLGSIKKWLDDHPEIHPAAWVALDDANLLYPFGELGYKEQLDFPIQDSGKQFLLVNPDSGLTLDNVNDVLDWFDLQPIIVCI